MRFFLNTCVLLVLSAGIAHAQTQWQNINVISQGTEKGRTSFMSYENRDFAVKNDYSNAKYYISLNGDWKFLYADDHRDIPVSSVVSPAVNTSLWRDIRVPGGMELQGYGNPVASKTGPAAVLDKSPAGVYKTRFELTLPWFDRDIFLHMDAFKSAVYVYLNGQLVGYCENPGAPVEFRLNEHAKDGKNDLTVLVYGRSTGNALECRQPWSITGITGDTYIYSQPKTRINDFYVTAYLDSTNYSKGFMKLDIELKNSFNGPENLSVSYDLINPAGQIFKYYTYEPVMAANSLDTLRYLAVIPNVQKWTAETPNLYTLILRIKRDGRFIEYIPVKIGFRNAQVIGDEFCINGKPVALNGVVFEQPDTSGGGYLRASSLRKEMKILKQNKINAIRTKGAPVPPVFYELCDEYGFYVFSEADIDACGEGYSPNKDGSVVNDPAWKAHYINRVERLYRANRNYPCVVAWSLGNDSRNGINAQEAYLHLQSLDSLHHPIVFKGTLDEWNTDIVFPAYSPHSNRMKDDRPLIIAEPDAADPEGSRRHPEFKSGFFQKWPDVIKRGITPSKK